MFTHQVQWAWIGMPHQCRTIPRNSFHWAHLTLHPDRTGLEDTVRMTSYLIVVVVDCMCPQGMDTQ